MRIKLTEDQNAAFKSINRKRAEVMNILNSLGKSVEDMFEEFHKKYEGYNFAGSHIDHIKGELVLPYQEEIENEDN